MFFIILVLIAITGLIGTDLFVPSLPDIAKVFAQPINHTELTITLFLASFAVSQLFYGPISDRIGRRTPLLFGATLFAIGSALCAFAPSFNLLCLGRIIQGIGVGGGLSLARVILRDTHHGVALAKRSSFMGMFVSLTPAVAPLIGGGLQEFFGYRASFIFLLIYAVILMGLLKFSFPETHLKPNRQLTLGKVFRGYGELLVNAYFMRYVFFTGIAFSAIVLYANVMPFITQNELGLSALANGEIILLAAIGISVGSFLSSYFVERVSSETLVKIGLFLLFAMGNVFILTSYLFGTSLYSLMPALFLVTVGCGLIFPNAVTLCFSAIHCNIGIAGAIYGSVQITTSMIVNLILNCIPHQNEMLLGLFYFVLGALGLVVYYARFETAAELAVKPCPVGATGGRPR